MGRVRDSRTQMGSRLGSCSAKMRLSGTLSCVSSEKRLGRGALGKAELQREPGPYLNPGVDMEALGRLSPGPGPSPSIDLGDCPSPAQPTAEMRMGTASKQLGSSTEFRLPINLLARHLILVSTSFPTREMRRPV